MDLLHHGLGGTSVCKVEGETQKGNIDESLNLEYRITLNININYILLK